MDVLSFFSMKEPNLNQTMFSSSMVISQGSEETLEMCLKTLYSQVAVKPVGSLAFIYTGWSVGISNNYIWLFIPIPLRPE